MSAEGDAPKKTGWGGFGDLKNFGASLQNKVQQLQEQNSSVDSNKLNSSRHGVLGGSKHGLGGSKHGLGGSKHGLGGSKHGLGGSKHGLGGSKHGLGASLMSRIQSATSQQGMNKSSHGNKPASSVPPPLATQPEEANVNGAGEAGHHLQPRTPSSSDDHKADSSLQTLNQGSPPPSQETNQQSQQEQSISSTESSVSTLAATPSLASRSPNDVSKEELLEILKKLNFRLKATTVARNQMIEKAKAAENDNARLLALIKDEILGEADYLEAMERMEKLKTENDNNSEGAEGSTPPETDQIKILQMAWRSVDERHQLDLQHMQNTFKVATMQAQAEVERVRQAVLEEKEKEILRIKEEMNVALQNAKADSGFLAGDGPVQNGSAAVENNEAIEQKDAEISHLKEEIAALKEKTKAQIDKVMQFKNKVAADLKTAKEDAAKHAKEAEDAKEALAKLTASSLENQHGGEEQLEASNRLLMEKEERIKELESSLAELKPLHMAEVERVREEMKKEHEMELKLKLEEAVSTAKDAQKELSAKEMEELLHKTKEEISSAMAAVNESSSTEMTLTLEEKHRNDMLALKQAHEEQIETMEKQHSIELERIQSESQTALC